MVVEIQINNSADVRARYLTWVPSACRIRVTDPAGVPAPIVNLRLEQHVDCRGRPGAVSPRAHRRVRELDSC